MHWSVNCRWINTTVKYIDTLVITKLFGNDFQNGCKLIVLWIIYLLQIDFQTHDEVNGICTEHSYKLSANKFIDVFWQLCDSLKDFAEIIKNIS